MSINKLTYKTNKEKGKHFEPMRKGTYVRKTEVLKGARLTENFENQRPQSVSTVHEQGLVGI